jgi:hypothetical protein
MGASAATQNPAAATRHACAVAPIRRPQKKGWTYHVYPAGFFLMVASGALLAAPRGGRTAARAVALGMLVLAAAMPSIGYVRSGWSPTGATARVRAITALLKSRGRTGDFTFAFVTSPRDVFPAVLAARRRWANAAGELVYLPAYLDALSAPARPRDFAAVKALADRQNLSVIRDLAARKPAIVLVDAGRKKLGVAQPGFDFLRFFAAHYPGFAPVWRHYHEQGRIGRFRVFVRDPQEPDQRVPEGFSSRVPATAGGVKTGSPARHLTLPI